MTWNEKQEAPVLSIQMGVIESLLDHHEALMKAYEESDASKDKSSERFIRPE